MIMKTILLTILISVSAFAQSVDCARPRPEGARRFQLTDDTGTTCYDLPAALTPALDAYVAIGPPNQQRNPQTGAPVQSQQVKFETAAQALLWQVLNLLAPQWIQAQGQAAIKSAAAALQAAKAVQ